jgi:hypothetical protein
MLNGPRSDIADITAGFARSSQAALVLPQTIGL